MSSAALKKISFDPNTASGPVIVLIGRRDTGKSYLVRDLLYYHQDIPIGTVISGTEAGNGFYGEIVPKLFIHDEYNSVIIEKILKRQRTVLKQIKKQYSKIDVIVGNIATAAAAKFLVKAGADGIKVGIGPGSICTTRVIAGVGYPQLSAIYEVSNAIKGSGVSVIADGGIKYTGDITKAIAAGADCVMLGSLLAGTKESPGETVIYEGRKFKTYRGMGSIEAMQKGSKDRYFQSSVNESNKLVPEGVVGRVPYKGDLVESIHQFVGGIRSGMGYCGCKTINDLKENGKFVQITGAGLQESHPHNVMITKESPNYSR